MTFLQGCIDFFSGVRTSHMGSYQYIDHAGMRDGQSMSGVRLWTMIENSELNSDNPNLFSAEELLLHQVAQEISLFIPYNITFLELGPGTPSAFRKKTLPLIRALQSDNYISVDESHAFLSDIASCKDISGIHMQPIEDDFFEGDYCYHNDNDKDALVCMFGSTIGNMLAPLSNEPPQESLVDSLKKLAFTTNKGWLLISFDADEDGEKVKSFYRNQSLFQLNVFDRIAAELPVGGDYDSKAFDYDVEWRANSGQLAHVAVLNRDMEFSLSGKKISLRKDQRLHMKNSYKFQPEFFEYCAQLAGLEVVKMWSNESPTKVCLLKKIRQAAITEQPHEITSPQSAAA